MKRLERNEIREMIIQTPLTFDRRSSAGFRGLPSHEHGAFRHLSAFQDRV